MYRKKGGVGKGFLNEAEHEGKKRRGEEFAIFCIS